MHLLLIHQAFASLDEAGGTRHYEMACTLADRGYRVTIIASPISYLTGQSGQKKVGWRILETPYPGITILRSFAFSALHRSFVYRVISFFSFMTSSFINGIGVGKVDLVWGTSPPIFQAVTAWLLARLKRAPFLLEIRDLWPEFAVAVGVLRKPLLIRASSWLESFLYRHADRVMVNSPGFLEHVRARGARQIELVPNGADPAMFDPLEDGHTFRVEHGLLGKFILLYAGAHGISNDLPTALEAARLCSSHDDILFLFLGDGKEKANLVARASELGLKNVRFLPPVPKSQIGQAIAAADACLAILKPIEAYKTTYPNKVFDYMAAGRPVVLAIDGVIRQVVEEAGAGLCVPPGDPAALAEAVLCLARDPSAAREMGMAGRACIEQHFSRTILTEKFIRLVSEMEREHARKNPGR